MLFLLLVISGFHPHGAWTLYCPSIILSSSFLSQYLWDISPTDELTPHFTKIVSKDGQCTRKYHLENRPDDHNENVILESDDTGHDKHKYLRKYTEDTGRRSWRSKQSISNVPTLMEI